MDSYDKPASVSSVLSDTGMGGGGSGATMSPHYYYVLHFPITPKRDSQSGHELNQRAITLYGFGQAREQARLTTKQIIKEAQKLFGRKACCDVNDRDGRRPSRAPDHAGLRARFLQLPYFDRHLVSESVVKVLMKRLSSLLQGQLRGRSINESHYLLIGSYEGFCSRSSD